MHHVSGYHYTPINLGHFPDRRPRYRLVFIAVSFSAGFLFLILTRFLEAFASKTIFEPFFAVSRRCELGGRVFRDRALMRSTIEGGWIGSAAEQGPPEI